MQIWLFLLCPLSTRPYQKHQWALSLLSDSRLVASLCNPMDCAVCGFSQAGILEWVAIPPAGGLPNTEIQPRSPTLQANSFPAEPPGVPKVPSVWSCVRSAFILNLSRSPSHWTVTTGRVWEGNSACLCISSFHFYCGLGFYSGLGLLPDKS